MDYQVLKAKTHGYILNANDKIDFYNQTIKQPANEKQLKMFEEEFDYYETIESMFNRFENSLERWLELLETDGIDSKNMVANDIQHILEEIKKDDR